MTYLSFFLLIIFVLISVSFFTLFERSVLGYLQIRKGPSSLGFMGLVQPFGDAIKLFSKELFCPLISNYSVYLCAPVMSVFLSLIFWLVYPFFFQLSTFLFGIFYFICVSSFSVYILLSAGWSSNSTYSMLGSLRGVAQTISYEVNMFIIMVSVAFLVHGFNFMDLCLSQDYVWFSVFMSPFLMIFSVTLFAEVNRSPFDFAEGESELVSGFNIEYGGGMFAFIFMAEYSSIMFMSFILNLVFFGGKLFSFLFFLNLILLMYLFVWVRGSFPRYRYDKLMGLSWKINLPISLNGFIFFSLLSYLLFTFILLSEANKSI